jgi:hypothetical protein
MKRANVTNSRRTDRVWGMKSSWERFKVMTNRTRRAEVGKA